MIFYQKLFKKLQSFWNVLSEKGEKQDKFIIYLLLIEVFIIILILGIHKETADLAVALGTISMALVIVYIEIIKPWLQEPKIKIEFKNEIPFCRDATDQRTGEDQYHIRLKIKNEGQAIAKKLRGKLVEVTKKNGSLDTDFDPLFLHWTTIEPKTTDTPNYLNWGSFLDPIDLNKKEYEFLDIFYVIQGQEESKEPIKIHHTDFPRGCLKKFGMDKIENLFKITIYGENIEPVSKTYELIWDGKNYKEIKMHRV